jgi:histone chaperone ASF1
LDNPTSFTSPLQFEITFECLVANLEEDLEWKVIYVKTPQGDPSSDLVLEEVMVGPIVAGVHSFILQANAPSKHDLDQVLGVTAVVVTCSYRDQEFCRIGFYVNNEFHGTNNEEQFGLPLFHKEDETHIHLHEVLRTILADKPRVTRFPIQWQDHHNTYYNYTTTESTPNTTESTPQKHNAIMETPPPMLVSPSQDIDM